jgi:hypothetical protein
MGVQLGVETTAGVLPEQSHHDPFCVDTHDVAVATQSGVGVVLDPAQNCLHRPLWASTT